MAGESSASTDWVGGASSGSLPAARWAIWMVELEERRCGSVLANRLWYYIGDERSRGEGSVPLELPQNRLEGLLCG